jgi:hypothetical protein
MGQWLMQDNVIPMFRSPPETFHRVIGITINAPSTQPMPFAHQTPYTKPNGKNNEKREQSPTSQGKTTPSTKSPREGFNSNMNEPSIDLNLRNAIIQGVVLAVTIIGVVLPTILWALDQGSKTTNAQIESIHTEIREQDKRYELRQAESDKRLTQWQELTRAYIDAKTQK